MPEVTRRSISVCPVKPLGLRLVRDQAESGARRGALKNRTRAGLYLFARSSFRRAPRQERRPHG
jgi:hypothetical protein